MNIAYHTECLLCGSTDLSDLAKQYAHAYLVQCNDCNLVFGKRIPSQKELHDHYALYRRNNPLSEITVKRYEALLEQFEPYRKTNRLLDVGCGDGHFLAVAKSKGWEVFGTEYTDEAVAAGQNKGITIHKGRIQEYADANEFDVITSFEVLEHINDGNEHVAAIHSLLRSGGLFYFTTPNFDALSRRVLGGKWKIIEYPEHLCYYTSSSMHGLISKNGFVRKSVLTTGCTMQKFPIAQKEGEVASRGDDLRESIEKRPLLQFAKQCVNGVLNVFRLGDTLKGYYVKP